VRRGHWRLTLIVLPGAMLVLGGAILAARAPWKQAAPLEREPATFVGRQACASCHAEQDGRWRGSDHDLAIQVADERSMLGDFGGATFTHGGVTSRFFRRDGTFFVHTDGPDGRLQDFPIAYAFGVRPLQQYLIALPGGRYQALGIAWDARPRAAGGQRWFHLSPGERIRPGDPLHWTGRDQTWNHMCAECHSTGLRKNYRPDGDRYETTWAELDVACEACHGPGSRHVAWAAATRGTPRRGDDGAAGLLVRLRDRRDAVWQMDATTGIARRAGPPPSRIEVETCARCHSRRGVVDDRPLHGRPLLDTHRPALLVPGLYHADGQILGEVYEYGSFLQSKMYRAGVTCSDCHDPHSLRVAQPPGTACARCHAPASFDTPAHHHHRAGTPGASCVACHMPTRTYMVVDPRRDHSLRVPRPDLSVKLGTPDACTACHRDRTPRWAAEALARWYPGPRPAHYGEAIHAGRRGLPGAEAQLLRLAGDPGRPAIARATAVSLLRPHASGASIRAVEAALSDSDPLVRLAAVEAAGTLGLDSRLRMLVPVLDASPAAVRIEAARALADAPAERLTAEQRRALDRGLADYRRAQEINADRPEAQVNLGALADQRGEHDAAERAYRRATVLDPTFVPAYVNLADHHRARQQDEKGERVLRQGLERNPDAPALHHSLGLLLVRARRYADAVASLARAAELAPDAARYAYVYGVALHSTGRTDRALAVLTRAHDRHPGDVEILVALSTINRDRGARDAARAYARTLLEVAPEDPRARQLLEELERGR
jgi:tetratricopeptide (TPR) repeat protein